MRRTCGNKIDTQRKLFQLLGIRQMSADVWI